MVLSCLIGSLVGLTIYGKHPKLQLETISWPNIHPPEKQGSGDVDNWMSDVRFSRDSIHSIRLNSLYKLPLRKHNGF